MPFPLPDPLVIDGSALKPWSVQRDLDALAGGIEQNSWLPGDLKATARPSGDPAGWLLCDGRAVSRATYQRLFDTIGTAYGAGDGSTTFNIPDFRGRVVVGEDGAAGRLSANDARGNSAGTQTHALSTAEMPAHTHGPGASSFYVYSNNTLGVQSGALKFDNTAIAATTGSTGGGGAHNNMQPYQVGNWLVKT